MGELDRTLEKQTPVREAAKIQRTPAYFNAASQFQDGALVCIERNRSIVAWRKRT